MIHFEKIAWDKSCAIVAACDIEIGWYGFVTQEQGNLVIKDIYVPTQQKLSATTCVIQTEGDNEILTWEEEMRATYPNGYARAWFHSHVNMGTSPSGTDATTFTELLKDQPYFIRLIMNKKEEVGITLAIFGYQVNITNFEVIGDYNEHMDWAKEIVKETKAYSSRISPTYTTGSYDSYNKKWYDSYEREKALYTPKMPDTVTQLSIGDVNVESKKKDIEIKLPRETAVKIWRMLPNVILTEERVDIEDLQNVDVVQAIAEAYPLYYQKIYDIIGA